MTTENVTGYNWRLEVGAATGSSLPSEGSETWSQVLDIEELTPPSPTRETQEWFVLDTAASKKIIGSISYTPCTGTLTRAYGDSIQNRLEDDANNGTPQRRNYRIIASDTGAEHRVWAGYCSKFEFAAVNNQGRVTFSIEIVVDGTVTITR
jgi:hypothetical protein